MANDYVATGRAARKSKAEKLDTEFTQLKTMPSDSKPEANAQQPNTTQALALLAVIFGSALLMLFLVYLSFPNLDQEEKQHMKLPRNINDAKLLGKVLSQYTDTYYMQVLGACVVTYIFLQTFAIPGSIFLSILSGYLFSRPVALILVCMCSAIGASFCYLLFYLVGRRLVWKYIPQRAAEWATQVKKHDHNLLNYMIFLRITPFLPNWFINICSPVIGVPMMPFFLGTLLGVAPPSFVAIQAGTTLQRLTSSGDAVSWMSVGVLAVLAILSLLPTFFKRRLAEKLD